MSDTSRRSLLALAAAAAPALAVAGGARAQTADSAGTQSQAGAGRAAIVTGSSRGIGAATAKRLARDGFAVTINYLTNADLAAQVVRDIEAAGGRAISRQADVADPGAVRALFDANDQAFGGVDVVISNAAIMSTAPFAQFEDAAFDRMIATNVKGSFNVLREARAAPATAGALSPWRPPPSRPNARRTAATPPPRRFRKSTPASCPRSWPGAASRSTLWPPDRRTPACWMSRRRCAPRPPR